MDPELAESKIFPSHKWKDDCQMERDKSRKSEQIISLIGDHS